jgi:hypothetical protein
VTTLVDRAIREAGLWELLEARRAGDLARVRALAPKLDDADLLAVGGVADRVRADEVGDVVRVFAGGASDAEAEVVIIDGNGLEGVSRANVLRLVAKARVTGPRGARVRVDWAKVGIELAQVALGFGANELAGPVLNRRGLPIADGDTKKVKGSGLVSSQLLKKEELFALVRVAGREPLEAVPLTPGRSSARALTPGPSPEFGRGVSKTEGSLP